MDWIQVTVETTTEASELVSQQLIEAGSTGTMIEDRRDALAYRDRTPEGRWDIMDDSVLENMPERVRVSGYYPADFRAHDVARDVESRMQALKARAGDLDVGTLEIRCASLDDEDWAENWKRAFVPFKLGEHIVIRPGWCDYAAQPGDKVITIDPGMAFGTGTHETTALCAELIEQCVRPGDSVIDVGTGSGILAIAAALVGAKDVLAIDIDPVAVRVAGENVRANGLDGVIRTRQGDLLNAVDEVADVVSANIIADVIIYLAEPVRAHIRPGGTFICSGIARERIAPVVEALKSAGYQALDIREKGEWAAIACRR